MSIWARDGEEGAKAMNLLERVLDEEMARLLERLSGSVPGGCLELTAARQPTLRRRIDEVESQMAAARASLLEGYGRWQRSLEDVENLWALAAWKCEGAEASAGEQPAEQTASLAA
jgi:hypothetical protein